MFLNESYYGKTVLLKQAEEVMGRIVKNIQSNFAHDATNTEDNKALMELFRQEFNFESFYLEWLPDPTMGNGYTVPISYAFDLPYSSYKINKTNKGWKYADSKGKHIYICLYNGLVTQAKLKPEEMMAVVLHEIGHNFYLPKEVFYKRRFVVILQQLINIIMALVSFNIPMMIQLIKSIPYFLSGARPILNFIAKVKAFLFLYKIPASIITGLVSTVETLWFFPQAILNVFAVILNSPVLALKQIVEQFLMSSYDDEKFADNFPTMYGYGTSVATAFAPKRWGQWTLAGNILHSNVITGFYIDFCNTILADLRFLYDPHPTNYTRVKDQIKMLESELDKKKSMPSSQKNEIRKQIAIMKEKYEIFNDNDKLYEAQNYAKAFLVALFGNAQKNKEDFRETLIGNSDYDRADFGE